MLYWSRLIISARMPRLALCVLAHAADLERLGYELCKAVHP